MESRLKSKLTKVARIEDIDRNLVATDLITENFSTGSHPVFLFKLDNQIVGRVLLAILGTSDKNGNRNKDLARWHTIKSVSNNALDHDTHFDLERIYLVDEKSIVGRNLKVMGMLSTRDASQIIKKVVEKIEANKFQYIRVTIT